MVWQSRRMKGTSLGQVQGARTLDADWLYSVRKTYLTSAHISIDLASNSRPSAFDHDAL